MDEDNAERIYKEQARHSLLMLEAQEKGNLFKAQAEAHYKLFQEYMKAGFSEKESLEVLKAAIGHKS